MRAHPNIAIAGTPGTGKSTLARNLADRIPSFQVLDINAQATSRDCHESYDHDLQSWVIDEDKVCGT